MDNELENNINYIKSKIGDNAGFSVPKNYMNSIEDDFLLKLSEEKLPNKTSFEVPDTYFDNLENDILNKVNQKKGKVISLKDRFTKLMPTAVAASLLLFIGLQFFNTQKDLSIDDISTIDIENWFDENNTYNDTEFVFSLEESIDEQELTFTYISVDDEAIEDYLSAIDHTDLLNEIQ